jgi:hypothetical protein
MAYERKTVDINVSEDLKRDIKRNWKRIYCSESVKTRHTKESLVESHVDFISISSHRGKISYLTSDRMSSVDWMTIGLLVEGIILSQVPS